MDSGVAVVKLKALIPFTVTAQVKGAAVVSAGGMIKIKLRFVPAPVILPGVTGTGDPLPGGGVSMTCIFGRLATVSPAGKLLPPTVTEAPGWAAAVLMVVRFTCAEATEAQAAAASKTHHRLLKRKDFTIPSNAGTIGALSSAPTRLQRFKTTG
jgi:hypothetical protein